MLFRSARKPLLNRSCARCPCCQRANQHSCHDSVSSLYVSRNGHESGRIKALEKEFIETFTKEMGTIDCSDLKAKYRNDEIKCNLVIFKAGEILDRIVEREGLN